MLKIEQVSWIVIYTSVLHFHLLLDTNFFKQYQILSFGTCTSLIFNFVQWFVNTISIHINFIFIA
jgi:hypothetical protein